jgi:hypothetical protein
MKAKRTLIEMIILISCCLLQTNASGQKIKGLYVFCNVVIDDSIDAEIKIDSNWIVDKHCLKLQTRIVELEEIEKTNTKTQIIDSTGRSKEKSETIHYYVSDTSGDSRFCIGKDQLYELSDLSNIQKIKPIIVLSEYKGRLNVEPHTWTSENNCINDNQRKALMQHYNWINDINKGIECRYSELYLEAKIGINGTEKLIGYIILKMNAR